jgi:hypothetical protein
VCFLDLFEVIIIVPYKNIKSQPSIVAYACTQETGARGF